MRQVEVRELCRVTMGHLRVTIGHLKLTIGYLKATVVHIRVTLGHLMVSIGHMWVTLFFKQTLELHLKVRPTCYILFFFILGH